MKYAYFAAGKAVLVIASPFVLVATLAGGVAFGALYLSHGLHLRAERWGR